VTNPQSIRYHFVTYVQFLPLTVFSIYSCLLPVKGSLDIPLYCGT